MNGETKYIIEALQELHSENKEDIKDIQEKLNNLPCKVHRERMQWFKFFIVGTYVILGVIVGIVIKHIGG